MMSKEQTESAAESVERLPEHWQKLIDQAPSEESRAIALERALFAQKIQPYIQSWKDKVTGLEAENERLTAALADENEACARIAESPISGQPHTEFMRGKMEAANRIARSIRERAQQAVGEKSI